MSPNDSKKILVIGAGLSSSSLIRYLIQHAGEYGWHITVADQNSKLAASKLGRTDQGTAIQLDIANDAALAEIVHAHDLVISLAPPYMHFTIAAHCLVQGKHLITASYTSAEMKTLHTDAVKNGLLFLNECGLDPGIDHMSAMQLIHGVQKQGGVITTFKSWCGGLVAPGFDNNPWHYKFTWNPRNVVLAGQSTACYLEKGEMKFIPASRIFTQTESVQIASGEYFEGYANRDSLEYIRPYGITSAETVLRGTLRTPGFCESWNLIVRLGLNDEHLKIPHADQLTYREWVHAFVPGHDLDQLESRLAAYLGISTGSMAFKNLEWLGLFSTEKVKLKDDHSASILQTLLEEKWKLKPGELDRIVMHHDLTYQLNGEPKQLRSSLVVTGEDATYTAMSNTVGLPMAIAAKLLLAGKIRSRGVQIPIVPEIYEPVLKELELFGVRFEHSTL